MLLVLPLVVLAAFPQVFFMVLAGDLFTGLGVGTTPPPEFEPILWAGDLVSPLAAAIFLLCIRFCSSSIIFPPPLEIGAGFFSTFTFDDFFSLALAIWLAKSPIPTLPELAGAGFGSLGAAFFSLAAWSWAANPLSPPAPPPEDELDGVGAFGMFPAGGGGGIPAGAGGGGGIPDGGGGIPAGVDTTGA